MTRSRGAPRLSRFALAVAAPAVILLLLEGICRVAGVDPVEVQRPFGDFDLGWTFVAGEEPAYFVRHPTRFFTPRPRARGVARTDDDGFRGGEHPPSHERLLRIAVLGDSTTFGFGVRYGDTFGAISERELRARCPGLDVDLVNAGCYGYSSYQNAVDLEERVLPLEPDVVVLCLSGFNDAVGAVGFPDEVWGAYSPRSRGPLGPWMRESRLVALLERALVPARSRLLIGDPEEAVRQVEEGGRPHGRRVPVESFERNVREMIERARRSPSVSGVVLMIHPHPASQLRTDPYRGRYADVVRRLASELAVPLVDGAEHLSPDRDELYLDEIHPTEEGHRLLAEGLSPVLLGLGVVQARCPGPAAERPRLDRVSPGEGYAAGGTVLTVRGSRIGPSSRPRFLVAGEPATILELVDDTVARVELPPCAPGRADLEVQTRNGSAVLPGAIRIDGPTLEIERRGAIARALLSGGPKERFRIHVATETASRPILLDRVLLLKEGTIFPAPVEGRLDAAGGATLEVPLPEGAFPALYVQALLEPAKGDYPRVLLPTNLAVLR